MSKYIGSRIVPKHCGTWDKTKAYEVLSLVLYPATGDSYISRKAVPAGIGIKNEEYWALSSEFSSQLKTVQDDVSELQDTTEALAGQIAANVAASTDSDADYAAEVVDARVGADGTAHGSLGDSIRAVGQEVKEARVGLGDAAYNDLESAMKSFSNPYHFREHLEITNSSTVLAAKSSYTKAFYANLKDTDGTVRGVKFTATILLDYDTSSIMTHTYIPMDVFREYIYGKELIIQLYSPIEGYFNFSVGSQNSSGEGDLDDTDGSGLNSSGKLSHSSISYNLYVHEGYNELRLNMSADLPQVSVMLESAESGEWATICLSMIPFQWHEATFVPETGATYDFYLAICREPDTDTDGAESAFSDRYSAEAANAKYAKHAYEADAAVKASHAGTADEASTAGYADTSGSATTASYADTAKVLGMRPLTLISAYSTHTGLDAELTNSNCSVSVSFGQDTYQTGGEGISVDLGAVSDFSGKTLLVRLNEAEGYGFASIALNFGANYGKGSYYAFNDLMTSVGNGLYAVDFDSVAALADKGGTSYDADTEVWMMFYGNSACDCDSIGEDELLTNSYSVYVEIEDALIYSKQLEELEEKVDNVQYAETAGSAAYAETSKMFGIEPVTIADTYSTHQKMVVTLSDDACTVTASFGNGCYQTSGQGFSVYLGTVSDFAGKAIMIRRDETEGYEFANLGLNFGQKYNTGYVTFTDMVTEVETDVYSVQFDEVASAAESSGYEFDDDTAIWLMIFGNSAWDCDAIGSDETLSNSFNIYVEAEGSIIYHKWIQELQDKIEELEESYTDLLSSTTNGNVLWGKKWFATGDSFTSGGSAETDNRFTDGAYKGKLKTYPLFIGIRNNMEVINDGLSGSIMAISKQHLNDPDNYEESYKSPFSLERYLTIPEDVDYITLWFGINDSGSTNLGTIDDETNETFYGAWNVVMEWILTNRPWAHVGIIITNGATAAYREAEREIALKWGIPYLDMMGDAQTPVMTLGREDSLGMCTTAYNLRRSTFSVGKTASGDSHPCWQAHEYESTFIEAFLRRL